MVHGCFATPRYPQGACFQVVLARVIAVAAKALTMRRPRPAARVHACATDALSEPSLAARCYRSPTGVPRQRQLLRPHTQVQTGLSSMCSSLSSTSSRLRSWGERGRGQDASKACVVASNSQQCSFYGSRCATLTLAMHTKACSFGLTPTMPQDEKTATSERWGWAFVDLADTQAVRWPHGTLMGAR